MSTKGRTWEEAAAVSIGAELTAAREAAGMTLEDVAERSRVRRTVIEHIEADDFTLCGGDVYARGHLRTLAGIVGADPAPLVAEFDRLHAPHGPSATEVFESETAARPERRGPNWTAAMAVALLVVAVIGVLQLVNRGGGSGRTAISEPTGSSSAALPTASASTTSPAPSSAPTNSAIAALPGGVTVRLTVNSGKSWLSVTTGSTESFTGIVAAGTTKVFTDPASVKLVLGNAGAVSLNVNGVEIGSPGKTGEVVRLSFVPGNPLAGG
ncbi:MAG TPA: RodZ domain-containing protein [Actinomycetes bacterium]